MSDVTRILNAVEQGGAQAADKLLPLVYEELRLLAAQKMSQERPGQTLQATALVDEAYSSTSYEDLLFFFTACLCVLLLLSRPWSLSYLSAIRSKFNIT
jgi:hypothetical protein